MELGLDDRKGRAVGGGRRWSDDAYKSLKVSVEVEN